MAADPPPSLLVTPDRRRRLQQLFADARQLAAQPRPPIERIHELLAECVRHDPGNVLYFDALLANLRQRESGRWSGWSLFYWLERWRRKRRTTGHVIERAGAAVLGTQYSVLASAPDLLWDTADDPPLLQRLAAAAGEYEFDEVELRLLAEARRHAPDDVETLRATARTLTWQGRFEEAAGPWHAVAALAAPDAEAIRAIEDLRFAAPTADERELADAQAARGADLAILVRRQDLRLALSAERVAIARRRAERDPHPRAQALVRRLEDDHRRLEIEMVSIRAEQFPTDASVRVQLARCLKDAGNYSGAVQVLEEALRLNEKQPAAWIELGECRQRLRQFEQALDCYERAISAAERGSVEELLLARYRAGVLAAAMGRVGEAQKQFEEILAVQPGYRDVEGRLLLIQESDDTRGSGPAGPP